VNPGTFRWTTAPGPAAIALLEVPALPALLDRTPPEPGRACLAHLVDPGGSAIDELVATRLDPDRLELATHAGPGIRAAVAGCLREHGLVEAGAAEDDEPWEAFAVAPCPAVLAWLRRGLAEEPPFPARFLRAQPVVLVTGPANAGKSSLLNAWCGFERALVADMPGTTRDLIGALAEHRGWGLRLLDGAGLREGGDAIEREGRRLVDLARARADLILHLSPVDAPSPPAGNADLLVHGKIDLVDAPPAGAVWSAPAYVGEARSAALLAKLADRVLAALGLPGDLAG